MINAALALARRGLRVFPLHGVGRDGCTCKDGSECAQPGKHPLFKGWQASATTSEASIRAWWKATPTANVGIVTDGLLVIDVDVKNGHNGFTTLLTLPHDVPDTYEQRTPSGGAHLVFSTNGHKLPNRVKFLPGLDTRATGGLIVGAGSRGLAGVYTGNDAPIAPAPEWLVELVQRKGSAAPRTEVPADLRVNVDAAISQAHQFLDRLPIAPDGERNNLAYKAACWIRDLGLLENDTLAVMCGEGTMGGGFRALPSMSEEEIRRTVHSAYQRGQNAPGAAAPEADFAPAAPVATATPPPPADGTAPGSPVDAAVAEMNKHYAYALAGANGNILYFTTDAFGQPETLFLGFDTFTKFNASKLVMFPGAQRPKPLTEVWMASPRRQTFRGIVFAPGRAAHPDFYNVWRGFAVEPYPPGEEVCASSDALARFLEHAQENVCQGDTGQYEYLISYFAHAIQKPEEKPQVALVFRGDEGVGKDTLVDTFGALLGPHYMNTAKRRQVTGDFNSALESCLALSLNEAFFHADKSIKAVMNELITSRTHLIERKGQEPYRVKNLLRVFIIGNDDTLVNASKNARRYQCFDVGDGRRGQPRYFQELREGMEAGGYRALLRFLLDWDLKGFNANHATKNAMLYEQKVEGLNPFHQWWRESLEEGRLLRYDQAATWPDRVDKEALRIAFRQYRKDRGIGGWEMQNIWIGRRLREACPALVADQKRMEGTTRVNEYRIPPLGVARLQWDAFIGHVTQWEA